MNFLVLLFSLTFWSTAFAQMSESEPSIKGATDGTLIGNSSDRLKAECTQSGSYAVTGTFWQATQPVSGTITANQGGSWTDACTQSGTWTVQPGNTANTTAWKVDGSAVTQPISAASLPLPAGAATAAKQPALGTAGSPSTDVITVQGITSMTPIKTDESSATGVPMINRTDVSTTVTASGNSSAFDTAGFAFANWNFNVTAISGTGAYIQFHTQTSDDGSNWTTYIDTPRMTATGSTRYQAIRQAGRYYRFTWDVAGTTPSITFTEISTLKGYAPLRKSIRFFYADIDLQTNGNVSSTFSSDDCHEITLAFIRGADGGNNGNVVVNASLDNVNWFSQTGNLAANPSASNTQNFVDSSYRFYQVVVSAHTNVGTRTLDIQWSCD